MVKTSVTVQTLKEMKKRNEKISMVTCYDYSMAKLVAQSKIDMILVGDSCGNIFAGYENTLPVTVDEIVYHTRAVHRGAPEKFIVADMPFLSYHITKEKATEAAGRLLKEGGAHSVKLEGGAYFSDIISHLTQCGIPVCGHLGLTPQSINHFGGHKVQGRDELAARKMVEDAKALEAAGAFAVVLELVPETLAQEISEVLTIPTIGIGAGRYTNGQVLVINDILGMDESFKPKMIKNYCNLAQTITDALNSYSNEVKELQFPTKDNSF